MKRIFFYCLLVFFNFNLFAQISKYQNKTYCYTYTDFNYENEIRYYLLENCDLYAVNLTPIGKGKKNSNINSSKFTFAGYDLNFIGEENNLVSCDYAAITNSDVFPSEFITRDDVETNIMWIPEWYQNLNGKKYSYVVEETEKRIPKLREFYVSDSEEVCYWTEHSFWSMPLNLRLKNTIFDIFGEYFQIKSIKKYKNHYEVSFYANRYFERNQFTSDYTDFKDFPVPDSNGLYKIFFDFDSNSLVLINPENNKIILKLIPCPSDQAIKFRNFLNKGNENAILNTQLTEILRLESEVSPSINVSVKKLMTTNCNLKLRAAEATSSNVLTVMAQGTKVKILELGKAETIDGISSNWVKVEVQKGAKDRDGKPIAPRTTGWCYGGYLE